MSALKTTTDEPALGGLPIARDQARALLGQAMGLVAVAVGFSALGAYLGRDLSGGTGLVLIIVAVACILGLNVAAAKGREQLAIGLLFGLGLLLGLAVAPVIADYAHADPSQSSTSTACAAAPPTPPYRSPPRSSSTSSTSSSSRSACSAAAGATDTDLRKQGESHE